MKLSNGVTERRVNIVRRISFSSYSIFGSEEEVKKLITRTFPANKYLGGLLAGFAPLEVCFSGIKNGFFVLKMRYQQKLLKRSQK